jgi:hypothetical protein
MSDVLPGAGIGNAAQFSPPPVRTQQDYHPYFVLVFVIICVAIGISFIALFWKLFLRDCWREYRSTHGATSEFIGFGSSNPIERLPVTNPIAGNTVNGYPPNTTGNVHVSRSTRTHQPTGSHHQGHRR